MIAIISFIIINKVQNNFLLITLMIIIISMLTKKSTLPVDKVRWLCIPLVGVYLVVNLFFILVD